MKETKITKASLELFVLEFERQIKSGKKYLGGSAMQSGMYFTAVFGDAQRFGGTGKLNKFCEDLARNFGANKKYLKGSAKIKKLNYRARYVHLE